MKGIYKLQIDVDMTLEICPVTIVILNLLVYGTIIQYSSTKVIIEQYHNTL